MGNESQTTQREGERYQPFQKKPRGGRQGTLKGMPRADLHEDDLVILTPLGVAQVRRRWLPSGFSGNGN